MVMTTINPILQDSNFSNDKILVFQKIVMWTDTKVFPRMGKIIIYSNYAVETPFVNRHIQTYR